MPGVGPGEEGVIFDLGGAAAGRVGRIVDADDEASAERTAWSGVMMG